MFSSYYTFLHVSSTPPLPRCAEVLRVREKFYGDCHLALFEKVHNFVNLVQQRIVVFPTIIAFDV